MKLRGFVPGWIGLSLWLVTMVMAPLAFGQEEKDDEQIEMILSDTFLQKENSVFVPVPREMLRPLIRANRAIKEKEVARAVSLLGEVLSESTDEDFLIPMMEHRGVSVSLRSRAQAILGALSTNDRDLYRLRYGVQAKQMLENAIAAGEFEKVSQVMQRFFFTRAGYDAAMILGHYHLDEGRVVAAANCFARVCDSAEARELHDPEASVLLAICWMLADSPSGAEEALVKLKSRTGKATIQFQDKQVRLFADSEDPLQWLKKLIGSSPLIDIEVVNQWVMVGGNPQRNARSGTGFPLINPRWSLPTLNDPDLEKSIVDRQRDLIFYGASPIPSVQPLAVGDTIVMRAFDQMIGVDFKTGKRKWIFPPWDFATQFDAPKERLKSRKLNQTPLTERMWEDSLYGQASSDGKKIFFIPSPGFTSTSSSTNIGEAGRVMYRPFNELKAIDIEREGAFLWEVGGETGLGEPKLANAFFLGAPLPLNGELYVVCQLKKEVNLVVLDSETGRLNWMQRLGTTENSRDIRSDRYRRLGGVMCSAADGMLICSTGNCALVAVDLSTRSLVWGYQYATPGRRPVERISPNKTSNSDPFDGLWRDTSIVIAEGKVFYTPVDSLDLVCVNMQTGLPGFRNSQGVVSAKANRNDGLYLACVEAGQAIIVGDTEVRAINTRTGEKTWACSLAENGKPSGRGFANRGAYYLPTSAEKLIKFDLKSGTIEKVVDTDGILGNLICYKGEVVSHGADRLAVFPQDEPFRERVELAETKGDLSAELLSIKSQLQIQDGDFRGGIESLKESFRLEPTRTTEKLLMKLVLQLVEDDFDYGMTVAKDYEEQLTKEHRFEFLVARINGMIAKGEDVGPIEILFSLLQPTEENEKLDSEFLVLSKAQFDATGQAEKRSDWTKDRASIRLDRWIASRIEILYDRGTDETKELIQGKTREFCIFCSKLEPVQQYEALRVFDAEWIDEKLRLELADGLIGASERLRADDLLVGLMNSADKQIVGQATALRLACSGKSKEVAHQNLKLINQLATEFGDNLVLGQKNGSELAKEYAETLGLTNGIEPESDWIQGKVSTTYSTRPNSTYVVPSPVELQACDDPSIADYRFQFFGQTGELEIIDPYGNRLHRFLARKTIAPTVTNYNSFVFGRISIQNNVAILDIATELFVFDWLKVMNGTDPVLWNTAVTGSNFTPLDAVEQMWGETRVRPRARHYENRIHVCRSGFDTVCYLDGNELHALDLHTGERLWQRSTEFPDSTVFGDAGNVVVWSDKMRTGNILVPKSGRLKAKTRLPNQVGAIWKTRGSRVLVSALVQSKGVAKEKDEQQGDEKPVVSLKKMVGLYDLIENQFVWKEEYPVATRACGVEYSKLAVLRPEGNLQFLNIESGKVEFDIPVSLTKAARKNLTGIAVLKLGDRYLVHLKRGETPNRVHLQSRNVELRYLNYTDIMWVGYIMCIDSETGGFLWDRPVRFENFQIVQNQPARSPVYFLSRRVINTADGLANFIQLAGIDLRSGQLAVNYLSNYEQRVNFQVACSPEAQDISIRYGEHEIVFELEEFNDGPPLPIAFLTNSNSIPQAPTENGRQLVAKEILDREKAQLFQQAKEFQKNLLKRQEEERERLAKERK